MKDLITNQNSNSKNNYSFYVVKKSEIIPDSDDKTIEEDDDVVDIANFFYYGEKIIQEYYFKDDFSTIYYDIGNDELAVLYEHKIDDLGNEFFSIYEKDSAYIAIQNHNKLKDVSYVTEENFNLIGKKESSYLSTVPIIKQIHEKMVDFFTINHSTCFITNFDFIDTKQNRFLAKKFTRLNMRYLMSSKLIPTNVIINEILSIIYHYIATHEIDENELLVKYNELQCFKDICPSSIKSISSFIHNKGKTDLENLCSSLQSNLKRIENLIDMYLDKELQSEKQKEY